MCFEKRPKKNSFFSIRTCQFGLRSFGHLISSWQRLVANKSLFVFVFCFVEFDLEEVKYISFSIV